MPRSLRTTLAALAMLASTVSVGAAHAAPPDPEPEGAPPVTDEHPLPAQGSDPKNGEAPATIPAPQRPPLSPSRPRNPVDALPGDVVFPRLDRSPQRPIIWKPEWARFKTVDWVITATGLVVTIGSAIIPPLHKHVIGALGVDTSVRNALRFDTIEGRYVARDVSDTLLSLEATWPLFVDALITTWWYHESPDAAAQMALIDGETLAVTTAVQGLTNVLVSRERPYGQNCGGTDPRQDPPNASSDCDGNSRYRSFFSGHTAFSFMSAGLICMHHEKLGLYGGGWADHLACVIAEVGATTTGIMRIVGDMHYVSDVGVGAAVGTLFGLGIPFLHYRPVNAAPLEKAGLHDVQIMPVGAGVGVGGAF